MTEKPMKKSEVIRQLAECDNWIQSVAGASESGQPHIQAMLRALARAAELLSGRK